MLENKFFKSILYFSIISAITCIFWYFGLESIGLPIFTGIAVLILIFDKNGINVVPFLLNMLFMISRTEWSMDAIPIYLYILPPLFLLAMIFHMIKNKIKLFDGKLKYPLLMLLAAMLLSTINAENFTIGYVFYYFIGIFYLFIYFFFKGSLKGDNLEYLIRLFSVLGVMISLQVLLFYLRSNDTINILDGIAIDLGWGIANFVATYLVMFITAMFYYLKNCKHKILYILIIIFEITMLFFTTSRGGFLTFALTSILIILYLFHKNQNKITIVLILITLFSLFSILIIFNLDYSIAIFHRLFDNFFYDNNRYELWKNGWESFTSHPMFGSGIIYVIWNNYFKLYHNTFLHTLATLGLFGFTALIWQFTIIIKVFLKNINKETIILAILLIAANIHGMIDNVYYMPQFMIIFFIIITAVENTNSDLT